MFFDIKSNFQVRVKRKRVEFEVGVFETKDAEIIEKLRKSKYASEKKSQAQK